MSVPQLQMSVSVAGRELASRESDGVHVRLLWHPTEDALTVSVEDLSSGQQFEIAVERDRGLDAFYHPFAYASSTSLVHPNGERHTLDLRQQV
jgi:hypothetical protein